MTIVRHYPETLPEPTETAFPGYPLGVWPPVISSFCNENATVGTATQRLQPTGLHLSMPLQPKDESRGAINEFENGLSPTKMFRARGRLAFVLSIAANRVSPAMIRRSVPTAALD